MYYVFTILAIASFFLMIFGLLNPKSFVPVFKKQHSRSFLFKLFGISLISSGVLAGIYSSPGSVQSTSSSNTNNIPNVNKAAPVRSTFANGTIEITNKFPTRTAFNKASFTLHTASDGATKVLVYRDNSSIASFPIANDKVDGTVDLVEGNNSLSFRLADDQGGLSDEKSIADINLHSTPPDIYTSCAVSTGKPTLLFGISTDDKEWACVDFGSATGPQYGTAYWPIHGAVSSNNVKVYINGKYLSPSSSDLYINQKVGLPVSLGTNIYEITVKDDLGNVAKDRVSEDWEDTSQSSTLTPDYSPSIPDSSGCCKVCTNGQACGDSCISWSYTCHKGPGCACQG